MSFFSLKQTTAQFLGYVRDVAAADRTLLARRFFLLLCDALVFALSFWLAFSLRLNSFNPKALQESIALLPALIIIGLGSLAVSGWYKSLTRATGSHSFYSLVPRTTFIVFCLLLLCTFDRSLDPPRSFWLLLWSLMTAGLVLTRVLARDLLRWRIRWSRFDPGQSEGIPSLIYGAGDAGCRVLQELRHDPGFHWIALIDDSPRLWNRRVQGISVFPPSEIVHLVKSRGVRQILLALPTAALSRRRALASELGSLGLSVLTIPSMADVASGRQKLNDVRPLSIEELLGREPTEPLPGLLQSAVSGKSVLVTGAGGSIGSELCRQILELGSKTLLLVEQSEFALYTIYQELCSRTSNTQIIPLLADVCDQAQLERNCRLFNVQVLLHAAAYKHVPLVEANVCSAISNNVNTTRSALAAAFVCGLERFTLISTDKAVRPTNVMGASKRICEMLVQNAAAEMSKQGAGPVCSMVRFGNVLGSSGSVVPLFKQQILAGGPVTVTHPEITRYFMTIPEAVQLVLQASSMAKGGEVFVLDMGEPVRIADLARQMIQLSGFSVRDEANRRGDISLEFTGLRPGEKLFEELLISAMDSSTQHPLIRQANEGFLSESELNPLIDKLFNAISRYEGDEARELLALIVPEYQPKSALPSPSS